MPLPRCTSDRRQGTARTVDTADADEPIFAARTATDRSKNGV
ncbi:MAG: hypothetical protein AVDCRST_MAG59-2046 [uncultured Thermomicrobiales bacterium]|uniref:Uncharacterized protein n=1 Tax=uncultured Thermomicrobiales bacterium TaxID=1645740 RepID=A0A6J4UP70_9BACT|nr:MAG: hypothetical protein AVDCRST_MAG59-2046 [uncultured Thermomicrobiales bacterium]